MDLLLAASKGSAVTGCWRNGVRTVHFVQRRRTIGNRRIAFVCRNGSHLGGYAAVASLHRKYGSVAHLDSASVAPRTRLAAQIFCLGGARRNTVVSDRGIQSRSKCRRGSVLVFGLAPKPPRA